MKRKKLDGLTLNELAAYFNDVNGRSLTCARSDYLAVCWEANRVQKYGSAKFDEWDEATKKNLDESLDNN